MDHVHLLIWCAHVLVAFGSYNQASNVCGKTPLTLKNDYLESSRSGHKLSLSVEDRGDICPQAWDTFRGCFAGIPPENVTAR